ncbi:arginine N-succinyltransferase (plasmid) [Legionella adelaidensis]|uniref:Arginine N-succinyltransferase n=1 Tax=Legionella adelaidensis TaxID=45056 RepID=A0A0W0R4K2_9GAMM|nr:arginine N-succinyltransferase [Legionella adelaidensis]KTC65964.1 arginine N-succinyltransferase, beta chain [Legionella adelaidensis]VEH86288.1 arginine N-succinyltransferase [Legionella adelaidensis]
MMLFRNAKEEDIEAIYQLALKSGVGITTLSKDINVLKRRLKSSNEAINKEIKYPRDACYFFVLVDIKNNEIVGTAAIESAIGNNVPFYSYKILNRTRICHTLNIRADYEVLSLVNDKQGSSEICTLYLDPRYRHSSNGLLLSRSRFLFIAQFRSRFPTHIIAEMRGVSNEKGQSPFWNAVGRHFFHMPFAQADHLTMATDKQFIADLMPRNPLYVKLLPPKVQKIIGKPHETTAPAMNILMQEGFKYENYVDIFDAGPTLEASIDNVYTVANNRLLEVKSIIDDVSSKRYIISNTAINFRATVSQALINSEQNACILSKDAAEILQVRCGDSVRVIPLKIAETFQLD